ncbi:hypothetical protein D3C86_1657300 [compost metagenome]
MVTRITPLAALEPYNAAAAALLMTTMLSMLFGSKSTALFDTALLFTSVEAPDWSDELLKGIPSTTIKGLLFPKNEVLPRMVMFVALPGTPLDAMMFTPATFPVNALKGSGSDFWAS